MAGDSPIPHPRAWPVRRLGEFAVKVGSGATPSGGGASYLARRHRWALVRSQNVFDRRFSKEGLAYISEEQAERLSGVEIQPRDILLNITGDGITFGRACEAPAGILPAVVNQHVSIVRVDSKIADPGFVLAYLTHPTVKHYIESFNAGGSRRAITKGHIESFCVPLPPLPEQRTIAHILGTLDDKIELNRRMNETLEAMALAIFKSWFVHFDPIRAKAEGHDPGLPKPLADLFPDSFDDSELGEIPKGWSLVRLDALFEFEKGKKPADTSPHMAEGLSPIILIEGFDGKVSGYAPDAGMIQATIDDILMVMDGASSGRVETGCAGIVGSTLAKIVRKKRAPGKRFLYYLLKHLEPETREHLTGTSIPHADKGWIASQAVCLPKTPDLVSRFETLVAGLQIKADANRKQSLSLAALRDTLLPKLISGELRVKDAERIVETV